MTKIDKSKLMKRAWEIAKNEKNYKSGRFPKPDLSHGLVWAWRELKEEQLKNAVVVNSAKKSSTGRYVELLSVAIKNGLKHGKSWCADGYVIDKYSLNPSWENEEVCYIYA